MEIEIEKEHLLMKNKYYKAEGETNIVVNFQTSVVSCEIIRYNMTEYTHLLLNVMYEYCMNAIYWHIGTTS